MATFTKNNEYEGKINLRCHSYKKGCCGAAAVEIGNFFENQPHTRPKNPDEIQKIKIESKMKNEAQRTPLAPRDIYNSNITYSSIEVSPFAKISSTMRKRRATVFPAVPKHFQDFDSLLKNSDLGRIEDNVFYRTYATANDEFALIFLPDLDINILDCVGRYTCQDFLKVVSHATHKSFDKFCDSKVAENLNEDDENDTALTPNDPIEFYDIGLECKESELEDYTKCSACELGKISFFAKPCGHMLCTFCIEDDNCQKCQQRISSKFAIFFEC